MSLKKAWGDFKPAPRLIPVALLSLAVLLSAGPVSAGRYGLMVGIDHYDPAYGPGDLGSCINDANGFRDCLLEDSSRWNASNITTITDSGAKKYLIRSRLSTLAGTASSGDLVVYFHSSHGGSNGGTSTYLCSYNADYNDWELAADLSNFANGVSVIIVIDACYSGGMFKENGEFVWPFARNVLENLERIKRAKGISRGPDVAFMTACDYYETCWAGDPYSLFAGYLIEGFTSGDGNGDGNFTFKELFDYAYPRALAENPSQHAQSSNNTLLSATIAAGVSSGVPLQLFAGDFNADSYSDIAVFRASSGLWSVRGITRVYFGQSGDIPIPADFDGDSTADMAVFRPSNGLWAVRGVTRFYYGASGDTPIPMNYHVGVATAGIFRPSNGLWSFRGAGTAYFGQSGDIPVPGPYVTRNGRWGQVWCAIFRPSNGLWALENGSRFYFGQNGDIPVPGAYTTGSTDPWQAAIFRPSSGLWSVRGVTRAYFGNSSDTPVPADYYGSWGDEMAIFRPSSGLWAIRNRTRIYYGSTADIPVTR